MHSCLGTFFETEMPLGQSPRAGKQAKVELPSQGLAVVGTKPSDTWRGETSFPDEAIQQHCYELA